MKRCVMRPEALGFADWQGAFAARIRDPQGAPRPPGAPARRMRVYEELLFNNVEGFLLACYPVTRKLLGARAWRQTVRRFFAGHRCHSPLFRDIPLAFLEWLAGQPDALFPAWPFLAEFMHYEWLELAVSIDPETVDPGAIEPQGDLLAGRPVLTPSARLVCYRYPVHRIGPRFKPEAPDAAPHCYLLFRDAEERVRFIVLNAMSARLLVMLRNHRPGGREALAHLAGQSAPAHYENWLAAGAALLAELRAQGVLLGTWRDS